MPGPLEALRVLDLTTDVAGPFATKLLADHGATVIKVEPPGGDPARLHGPFPRNQPNPEASGRYLYLNTNKRSIVLDIEAEADRATIEQLAARSDVIIEDRAPGDLARLGLGYEHLDELRPGIVLTSITPWGQDGPFAEAGYRLTDITAQGMGGPMLWTGNPDRHPLRLGGGGAHAMYQAGAVAALATMMAVYRQEVHGQGDHVDISIYETQIGTRDRSGPYLLNYIYNGTEPRRQHPGSVTLVTGTRPCLDGYVNIRGDGGNGPRLPAFLRMIGLQEFVDVDELERDPNIIRRIKEPELAEVIEAVYMRWLSEHTKREAAIAAQDLKLIAAPVNTLPDLLADPHFRDRGMWEPIDHPETGRLEYPGRPAIFSESPRPAARRAPLLDEHRDEILAELQSSSESEAGPAPTPASGAPGLPLAGVRIAEITVAWAGPYGTQLLAEWGAEIIRVEPVNRIQPATRWAERHTSVEMELDRRAHGISNRGGYPNDDPGDEQWNRNSGFNSQARNKLSVSMDVMDDESRLHFLELIKHCDVFIENNVPETVQRMGITYEQLREVNPAIIMLRMPAYGLSGPYGPWRSFGTHVEGMIGHQHTRTYPDGTPDEAGDVYSADGAGGTLAALLTLLALRHRRRTGQGQHIEMALAEGFIPYLGELILEIGMNGVDPSPWGNHHRTHAPHNAYPTLGEDCWIAIEAEDDADFAAICEVLECPELVEDARFATMPARKANEDELDALLSERTAGWEKFDLFRALQAVGVAAGPLQSAGDRLACPHLNAHDMFQTLDQAATGPQLNLGPYWRMARTPNRLRRGPATIGQDNAYVYRDLVGLSDAEYERMQARGIIGTTIPPEIRGLG